MKVPGIIVVVSAAVLVGTNAISLGTPVEKDGVEMTIPDGVPCEITKEWMKGKLKQMAREAKEKKKQTTTTNKMKPAVDKTPLLRFKRPFDDKVVITSIPHYFIALSEDEWEQEPFGHYY